MPWAIRKAGSQWEVYKEDTGKTVAKHSSREKAVKQLRLLYMVEKR